MTLNFEEHCLYYTSKFALSHPQGDLLKTIIKQETLQIVILVGN